MRAAAAGQGCVGEGCTRPGQAWVWVGLGLHLHKLPQHAAAAADISMLVDQALAGAQVLGMHGCCSLNPESAATSTSCASRTYRLVKALGLLVEVAVGQAVLLLQVLDVATQHPAQHAGHGQVHGHIASHLPCSQASGDCHRQEHLALQPCCGEAADHWLIPMVCMLPCARGAQAQRQSESGSLTTRQHAPQGAGSLGQGGGS